MLGVRRGIGFFGGFSAALHPPIAMPIYRTPSQNIVLQIFPVVFLHVCSVMLFARVVNLLHVPTRRCTTTAVDITPMTARVNYITVRQPHESGVQYGTCTTHCGVPCCINTPAFDCASPTALIPLQYTDASLFFTTAGQYQWTAWLAVYWTNFSGGYDSSISAALMTIPHRST